MYAYYQVLYALFFSRIISDDSTDRIRWLLEIDDNYHRLSYILVYKTFWPNIWYLMTRSDPDIRRLYLDTVESDYKERLGIMKTAIKTKGGSSTKSLEGRGGGKPMQFSRMPTHGHTACKIYNGDVGEFIL